MIYDKVQTVGFLQGLDPNDITEETAHKMHQLFVDIIASLKGRKYFKKFTSLNDVKVLASLCEASLQSAIDNRTKIPMVLEITGQDELQNEFQLNHWSFIVSSFYEDGLREKLKDNELLDFINDKCKETIDMFRSSIKMWEEEVRPYLNKQLN